MKNIKNIITNKFYYGHLLVGFSRYIYLIFFKNLNKLNFRYNTLSKNKDLYLPTLLNKNGFKFFFYVMSMNQSIFIL